MGIILWIIFGGLAGWLASLVMNTDAEQGYVLNVIVGIIGALVGGWVMTFLGNGGISGFNLYSFFVAVIGSIIFLFLLKLIR
jgi:uncharacterized membrane protein YeaQ/YmgE (transglycosylase-associated protein family)